MARYFFEILYNGTDYHGWQRQLNALSVQQVVEESLGTILRNEIGVVASGRTDTGVHCEQQFFHIELDELPLTENQIMFKMNSLLPKDIAIHEVFKVADDMHARFSATSRSYQYRITTKKNPFKEKFAYYHPKALNIANMNEAATLLLGEQDFESFSKVKTDVNTFMCNITHAKWKETEHLVTFDISANRFLRGMVRAIVGTLLQVGTGKCAPLSVQEILLAKDRRKAGAAAPAKGLFLTKVEYPLGFKETV